MCSHFVQLNFGRTWRTTKKLASPAKKRSWNSKTEHTATDVAHVYLFPLDFVESGEVFGRAAREC
jgi:hypothetical protein